MIGPSGEVWSTSASAGFQQFMPQPAADANQWTAFTTRGGLTSDGVQSLMIAKDRTIWVGTELGLDHFQPAAIRQEADLPTEVADDFGLIRHGRTLYLNMKAGVFELTAQGRRRVADGSLGMCAAGDGIWLVYRDHVAHFPANSSRNFHLPGEPKPTGICAEDGHGRLWLSLWDGGAIWHDSLGLHGPDRRLPPMEKWDLAAVPGGGVAYGTANDLVVLNNGKAQLTRLAPLKLGMVQRIAAGKRDIYVSLADGLARIRDGRVAAIDWRRAPWAAPARDLIEAPNGDLWILQSRQFAHVRAGDLARAFANPNAPLPADVLDLRDGLNISGPLNKRQSKLGFAPDGRLWQANRFGFSSLDPRAVEPSPPLPAKVTGLSAGALHFRDPTRLILPPASRAFDIAFTALDYSHADRVRYRYRIDGIDDGWVESGQRRLASYTNVGPGDYRFQVQATSDEVHWGEPATLSITVRPTFFESWPFRLLCLVAGALLLWLLFSLRLRTLGRRIRSVMAARMVERERVARELHDTLLQSVQGLMFRFQIVADEVTNPQVRTSLDRAMSQADEVLREGRSRVRLLREGPDTVEVAQILGNFVASLGAESARVNVETMGEERALLPAVRVELLRVAEEAIRNASKHAEATAIAVLIDFQPRQLTVTIRDDGRGIPADISQSGTRPGHYGLIGMRERARQVGGKLKIVTSASRGTEVRLRIPARNAYAIHSGRGSGLWRSIVSFFTG